MASRRACLLACTLGAAGCATVPPVNPGFVDTVPRRAGQVDVSAVAGVGTACLRRCLGPLTAGSLHADPFVAERSSLPLEAAVVDDGRGEGTFLVPTRLGFRHRFDAFTLGAGTGPTFGADVTGMNADVEAAVGLDLLGARWSLALRPTYSMVEVAGERGELDSALYFPAELAAMVDVGAGFALGGHLLGGAALTTRYRLLDPALPDRQAFSQPGGAVALGAGVAWGAPARPGAVSEPPGARRIGAR